MVYYGFTIDLRLISYELTMNVLRVSCGFAKDLPSIYLEFKIYLSMFVKQNNALFHYCSNLLYK